MDEERKAFALEQLKRDRAGAPRREDLIKAEIKSGANPVYVAFKYGVDVERCERYAAALARQREEQREREKSTRGDTDLPEIGEVVNGS